MRKLALAHLFTLAVLFAPTLLGQHLEFAATFGTGNFTRGCYLGFGCTPSTATNIAVDGAGNIYVAGTAISDVFPAVNPIALFQSRTRTVPGPNLLWDRNLWLRGSIRIKN